LKVKIVLLGGSYVSRVLLQTAKRLRIPVFGVDAKATAEIKRAGIEPLSEAEAARLLEAGAVVYSNADDVLPFLRAHSSNRGLLAAVDFFKDKAETRRLSNELLGSVFFDVVKNEDLDNYGGVLPSGVKVVVKPACGFHSLGVRRVERVEDWGRAVEEIRGELAAFAGSFDSAVVNGDKFVVEEYLEGDEYACDAFFDADGKPVVVGLYKHDFAGESDVRDCVYYTSARVLEENLGRVQALLQAIADKKNFRSLPIHFEFRACENGLRLVEVNPLRFGGFGLADLAWHAYGFNPYEEFLSCGKPNWRSVIQKMGAYAYAFVVGQAFSDRSRIRVVAADFEAFKKTFSEVLSFTPLDFTKYSFFATVLTRSKDLNELRKYLFFDFDEYFCERASEKDAAGATASLNPASA
jgi:hypothetical protein